MGEELERIQRRLFKAAADRQKSETKQFRRTPKPKDTEPERIYCDGCLAVLRGPSCPRCSLGEATAVGYCRRCLHVHDSAKACEPWAASAETYRA